jgi:hypothetical protein
MLTVVAALALGSGEGRSTFSNNSKLVAQPWHEAEALFTKDPRWIGGDAVYSIDLGKGRTLWLFGDSFIATSSARKRSEAKMIPNTIALQKGYDVTSATMKFFWKGSYGEPTAFVPDPTPSTFYWPAHGAKIGNRLLLFLWEVERSGSGAFGFRAIGSTAVAIDNSHADPSLWTFKRMPLPANDFDISMGSAVVVEKGFLYAYCVGRLKPDRTYLARWPLSAVRGNSLADPEWYAGKLGWVSQTKLEGRPSQIGDIGQSEFTVHATSKIAPYLLIQTSGFGAATLSYQTAAGLTGSYSGQKTFYTPPEKERPGILIYSAKMHPMLNSPGYDVVASYSVNHFDFASMVNDMNLYFPKFVRAKWVPTAN